MLKNPTKPVIFAVYFLMVILVTTLDRWSKTAIEASLTLGQSIHIGSLFYITLVHNRGGAFGILQGQKLVFVIVGVLVIGAILFYLYRTKNISWWMLLGLGAISAGAVGNLYDRVTLGYVIDFIDVHVWDYVFNVADIAIDVGFGAILIDMILSERQKNKETAEKI